MAADRIVVSKPGQSLSVRRVEAEVQDTIKPSDPSTWRDRLRADGTGALCPLSLHLLWAIEQGHVAAATRDQLEELTHFLVRQLAMLEVALDHERQRATGAAIAGETMGMLRLVDGIGQQSARKAERDTKSRQAWRAQVQLDRQKLVTEELLDFAARYGRMPTTAMLAQAVATKAASLAATAAAQNKVETATRWQHVTKRCGVDTIARDLKELRSTGQLPSP